MSIAYLGIGSNIGNRQMNFKEAVRRLNAKDDIEVIERSSFYPTRPAGGPPQEDYLNGVLKIETPIPPEKLLQTLKDTEEDMGRIPAGRDHARIIDIDILLYDDMILRTGSLVIPHPRMHERYFVLRGLSELAPDVMHPVFGRTVAELYRTHGTIRRSCR
jgi:2-amino-4-hydroxy-6-hydroxymethyldihydropteridine diphosphokinase